MADGWAEVSWLLWAPSTNSGLATNHTSGGAVRMGGGQDRHVIQMIANASLDAVEDVMRKENTMHVPLRHDCAIALTLALQVLQGS